MRSRNGPVQPPGLHRPVAYLDDRLTRSERCEPDVSSWNLLLGAFIAYMVAAGLSAGTIKLRQSYLRRLERAFPEHSPLELSAGQLVEYVASQDWSPESRKSARAAFTTFYSWCVTAGLTTDNPADRLPAVRVPPAAPRPTPTAVLEGALQRAGTDRDRLMLMFAMYAGLRCGEISRVHPRDFTDAGLLVRGKGGRERIIPVHPALAAAVRQELERRAAGRHGTGWRFTSAVQLDGYLFPGRYGSGVTPENVSRRLSRLLGPGWTGHTLRHRFASRAYAAERDLRAVQELLGHSKPETTARYVQVPSTAKHTAVLAAGELVA